MITSTLELCQQKIINWNKNDYQALARSMSSEELAAMRYELILNHYPIDYDTAQSDYAEQTVYDYILFLLYEAEYSDFASSDTKALYDVLFSICK